MCRVPVHLHAVGEIRDGVWVLSAVACRAAGSVVALPAAGIANASPNIAVSADRAAMMKFWISSTLLFYSKSMALSMFYLVASSDARRRQLSNETLNLTCQHSEQV